MKFHATLFCMVTFLLLSWAWALPTARAQEFQAVGQFSLRTMGDGTYEISDGLGRVLHLVPRGWKRPAGVAPHEVIYIPVERVAMTGGRDTSLLLALDSIDKVVAVTGGPDDWTIPQIKQGLLSGKIVSLGQGMSLDLEALVKIHPDVLFTWDETAIPKLADLGIPVVINYGDEARTLDTAIQFARFLAPFFGKSELAEKYVARVKAALEEVRNKTAHVSQRPRVIWGDVYEKRVLVEPGQSWAAQLVDSAGGDYLFRDVRGTSCLEVSLERFFSTAKRAQVMFTYRTTQTGINSKEDLAKANPVLGRIYPLQHGRIYSPLPRYHQSGNLLDQIIRELAAILQPDLFPGYKLQFFFELPEK
jgi:iron complex transport system substrate-binding protein